MLRRSTDWNYSSLERRACKAQKFGRCYMPRGKMVGGSASMNMMYMVRGSPYIYDRWENVFGYIGWAFRKILKYFLKVERNTYNWNNPAVHSQTGKQCMGFYDNSSVRAGMFIQSSVEAGIAIQPDINSAIDGSPSPGIVPMQCTASNGVRYSAAKAYIQPIKNQQNYRLIHNATVIQVLLDANNRAYGVLFELRGQIYEAHD